MLAPESGSDHRSGCNASGGRRQDLRCLAVLLVLATAIHAWLIGHTAVTARDGVGFIRFAWQLQQFDQWPEVMRNNSHPPGYPLAILAVSVPIRKLVTGSDSATMQLSAQIASSLAGVLLVIPMFYLGRELFDRRTGFWAALLFQCLPVSGRAMSDALAEGLFLLFVSVGLLVAMRSLRKPSPVGFGVCGLCAGLAYLTRPEGLLMAIVPGLVLLGAQAIPSWRRPWKKTLIATACLVVTALAVGGPYAAVIGHITNKQTGQGICNPGAWAKADPGQEAVANPVCPLPVPPLCTLCFLTMPGSSSSLTVPWAVWQSELATREMNRLQWSFLALLTEVFKGFHYAAWLPALAGVFWFRAKLRQGPQAWLPLVLVLAHAALLWRVAYQAGYLAERHTLMIVMIGLLWAAADVLAAADIMAGWVQRMATGPAWGRQLLESGPAWARVILVGLAATALPKTLEPLHSNRTGHHAAGLWLADHVRAGDIIVDPFCWGEYYAGQVFRDPDLGHWVPTPGATVWVILGASGSEHPHLPLIADAKILSQYGTKVYHWPAEKIDYKAEAVVIFAVPTSL